MRVLCHEETWRTFLRAVFAFARSGVRKPGEALRRIGGESSTKSGPAHGVWNGDKHLKYEASGLPWTWCGRIDNRDMVMVIVIDGWRYCALVECLRGIGSGENGSNRPRDDSHVTIFLPSTVMIMRDVTALTALTRLTRPTNCAHGGQPSIDGRCTGVATSTGDGCGIGRLDPEALRSLVVAKLR